MINHIKWFWQRRTRGWDDREIWSLDHTFAEWVVPRLELLRERKHGVPASMFEGDADDEASFAEAEKRWNEVMDKMIYGFKLKAAEDYCWIKKIKEYEEAKRLFCEHLDSLWD